MPTRPAEDFARGLLTLRDPDGNEAVIEATTSWAYVGPGLRITLELLGPEYAMEFNSLSTGLKVFLSREVTGNAGEDLVEKQNAEQGLMPVLDDEAGIYGYTLENRHFVDAFRAGRMPDETFADGVAVVEMLMALYRSAELGRTIALPDPELESLRSPRRATAARLSAHVIDHRTQENRMNSLTRRSVLGAVAAVSLYPAARAQSPVTLKIAYPAWDTSAQQAAVTGIFAEYEKQNPNVKIELISLPFPVLRQRLVVSARAGDPPDVAYVDGRWVPEMAAPGLLSDITGERRQARPRRLVRRALEGRDARRPHLRRAGPHRPLAGLLQHRAVPEGRHRRPSRRRWRSSPRPPSRSPATASTAGA